MLTPRGCADPVQFVLPPPRTKIEWRYVHAGMGTGIRLLFSDHLLTESLKCSGFPIDVRPQL